MARTTVDIDAPIGRELKPPQKRERKSLERLVSDLLAQALGASPGRASERRELTWVSRSMGARVDLADRDAVLDRP